MDWDSYRYVGDTSEFIQNPITPTYCMALSKRKTLKHPLVVHKFSIVEIFKPVGIQ